MNRIFFAMIAVGIGFAAWNDTLTELQDGLFLMLRTAVLDVVFPLIGTLAFFLGLMKIAERAGAVALLARGLRPILCRLFPDVPADHPAMGAIVLNLSANALGLGNAATPFGIRAMQHLDQLNTQRGTASNAMCLFVAINTSSVLILPTEMIALRSALGSDDPLIIVPTTLMATAASTTAAIIATLGLQRLSTPHPDTSTHPRNSMWLPLFMITMVLAAVLGIMLAFGPHLTPWILPSIIFGIFTMGILRDVPVYETFVEGAKEGFQVAVQILPYVVAILAAVGMLRGSGAIDAFVATIGPTTAVVGIPAEILPLAGVRPLSGSGALGVATSIMQQHGPDSPIGILASTLQASTETTFYVLAVYGGAVGLKHFRHAIAAALTADVIALLAAVTACTVYGRLHL